jgi:hypothetical protein
LQHGGIIANTNSSDMFMTRNHWGVPADAGDSDGDGDGDTSLNIEIKQSQV